MRVRASISSGVPLPSESAPGRRRWHGRLSATPLLAFLRQTTLDRELAAGVDPATTAQLGARAAQLVRPRNRRRLAAGLEALLTRARRPASSSSVVQPRANVLRSQAVLEAMQRRLRSDESLAPQGVAMLRQLLIDVAGPLYAARDSRELSSVLRLVAASLTDHSKEA